MSVKFDALYRLKEIRGDMLANIHYGDTAPEDASKLWISGNTASKLYIKSSDEAAVSKSMKGLPESVENVNGACVNDKVYLFGGYHYYHYSYGSTSDTEKEYLNTINVLDLNTNTMETLTVTLPVRASGIGVAAVGDMIYLFGGQTSDSAYSSAIRVFDTTTNTLTTLSQTLPVAQGYVQAVTVGSKIYLVGIKTTSDGSYVIAVFDTTTNEISTVTTLTSSAGQATLIGSNIYFGVSTTRVFNTNDNTITDLDLSLPSHSWRYLSSVGTKLYFFGADSSSPSESVRYLYAYDTINNVGSSSNLSFSSLYTQAGVIKTNNGVCFAGGYWYSLNSNYYNTQRAVYLFFPEKLDTDVVKIKPSLTENIFKIIEDDTDIWELGVEKVYRGDVNGGAFEETAKLYDSTTSEWVTISGE